MFKLKADNLIIKYYNSADRKIFTAVEGVNFEVLPSQFTVIVGPSGCGKTSVLNAIAGLLPLSSGSLLLDDHEITGVSRGERPFTPTVAMVFQSASLLPWRNVLDNVSYGLEIQGYSRQKRYEKADQYLHLVGLSKFKHCFPHQLSGGMQQRVNLARALTVEPSLLLLDEPFSALDALTREYMQEELQRIWLTINNTVVYITHLIDEAIFLADQILVMSASPGTIKDIIKVDFPRPRSLDLKHQTEFNQLQNKIWNLLKTESIFS